MLLAKTIQEASDAIVKGDHSEIQDSLEKLKKHALKNGSTKAIIIYNKLINKTEKLACYNASMKITNNELEDFLDKDPSNYEILFIYAKKIIEAGNAKKGIHLLQRVASSEYKIKEKAKQLIKEFKVR